MKTVPKTDLFTSMAFMTGLVQRTVDNIHRSWSIRFLIPENVVVKLIFSMVKALFILVCSISV